MGVTPRTRDDAEYLERQWSQLWRRADLLPDVARARRRLGAPGLEDSMRARGKIASVAARGAALLSLSATVASAQSRESVSDAKGRHKHGRWEVTKVDAKKGWIDVKTHEGSMKLHFPPEALARRQEGQSRDRGSRHQGQRAGTERVDEVDPEVTVGGAARRGRPLTYAAASRCRYA